MILIMKLISNGVLGILRNKVEKMGLLNCLQTGFLYEKISGGKIYSLLYNAPNNLYNVIVQTSKTYPFAKYCYQTHSTYPKGTLKALKVILNDNTKISFSPEGKVKHFLFNGKCYFEKNNDTFFAYKFTANLCSNTIEAGYYDGRDKK